MRKHRSKLSRSSGNSCTTSSILSTESRWSWFKRHDSNISRLSHWVLSSTTVFSSLTDDGSLVRLRKTMRLSFFGIRFDIHIQDSRYGSEGFTQVANHQRIAWTSKTHRHTLELWLRTQPSETCEAGQLQVSWLTRRHSNGSMQKSGRPLLQWQLGSLLYRPLRSAIRGLAS